MKIGTIGTGFIVERFLNSLEKVQGAECVAMYSRHAGRTKPFIDQFGQKDVFTNLSAFMANEEIDFVYIASPNSLHFQQAKQALEHGKNVICEKPFTSTVEEAEVLVSLAKEKGLMLFEAITTIHLPNYQLIKRQLPQLGHLKIVQCNYSQYSSRYTKLMQGELPNVFNLDFSGGALSDINIYNIHFIVGLFGQPKTVQYFANKHENGIDTSGIVMMVYEDFIVECVGAKDSASKSLATIQGDSGYLEVRGGANSCEAIDVFHSNKHSEINRQTEPHMYYELAHFQKIYQSADFEARDRLLNHSLNVMEVYEKARQSAQIKFKND